jgi:aspartate carbamoyltransferase catalytic subunit
VEEYGVETSLDLREGIRMADVIIVLRIQKERLGVPFFPSVREYSRFFGIDREKLKSSKKDVLILHPGPVNRGIEISPDVADGSHSLILNQVANGVALRMALLYLLTK